MTWIALCDDEKTVRDLLKGYLNRYSEETGMQLCISEFSSGESLLSSLPGDTDLILLDIEMGGQDGLETARRIKELIPDMCIIFITGFAKYALKSYSVKAFGFLPKPVTYPVFKAELSLAMQQLEKLAAHFILLKDRESNDIRQIDIKTIRFFEVRNHDIIAVLDGSVLYYRSTMNNLEKELSGYGFFRCHASYLINQRYISSIGKDVIMSDGTVIPISRNKRKEFLQNIANYVGATL